MCVYIHVYVARCVATYLFECILCIYAFVCINLCAFCVYVYLCMCVCNTHACKLCMHEYLCVFVWERSNCLQVIVGESDNVKVYIHVHMNVYILYTYI